MSSGQHQRMVGVISASILMCSSLAAFAGADSEHERPANINLAVASNFYGVPPSNSAITDLISAFKAIHRVWTVTVVDTVHRATRLRTTIARAREARCTASLSHRTAWPSSISL
jgi:hypothetical protein